MTHGAYVKSLTEIMLTSFIYPTLKPAVTRTREKAKAAAESRNGTRAFSRSFCLFGGSTIVFGPEFLRLRDIVSKFFALADFLLVFLRMNTGRRPLTAAATETGRGYCSSGKMGSRDSLE